MRTLYFWNLLRISFCQISENILSGNVLLKISFTYTNRWSSKFASSNAWILQHQPHSMAGVTFNFLSVNMSLCNLHSEIQWSGRHGVACTCNPGVGSIPVGGVTALPKVGRLSDHLKSSTRREIWLNTETWMRPNKEPEFRVGLS